MKFFALLALAATAQAITLQKQVPGLPNMGNSNDVALTAGQAVAASVVAK